jgi:carboxypeptidase C (cathepsin A)
MEWSGQREYVRGKWRVWGIDDSSIHPHAHQWINADWTMEKEKRKMSKGVGITKSAGPLTYASIWEAGHMISISTLLALTH